MDDWIVKLRQFQRRTGIRDPKLDAQLKGYLEGAASFGRLWFDKPEVTSTVSSQEFRRQILGEWAPKEGGGEYTHTWPDENGRTKRPTWGELYPDRDWWKSALNYSGEGIPTRGFGKITGISKWEKQSREDRYRYEVMSKVEVVHSGISAHLNVALWGDDFQYGTSFRERLVEYWGKLLFCVRRLW